jgi:hypothetical protein
VAALFAVEAFVLTREVPRLAIALHCDLSLGERRVLVELLQETDIVTNGRVFGLSISDEVGEDIVRGSGSSSSSQKKSL